MRHVAAEVRRGEPTPPEESAGDGIDRLVLVAALRVQIERTVGQLVAPAELAQAE
jgi:hypothetical protein